MNIPFMERWTFGAFIAISSLNYRANLLIFSINETRKSLKIYGEKDIKRISKI